VNSLKSALAHANYKIEVLEDRIDPLLAQMEKEKSDAETQMFCLSERLRQHHELENEMLAKIEKLEKTKKVSKK
jgi:PP-loop superfamily ATP-utilizing enzyme